MKRPHISAVINVRNEAKNLNKCLKSISDFADEIIVVDMHSTDGSIEIAKKYLKIWCQIIQLSCYELC